MILLNTELLNSTCYGSLKHLDSMLSDAVICLAHFSPTLVEVGVCRRAVYTHESVGLCLGDCRLISETDSVIHYRRCVTLLVYSPTNNH